MTTEQPNIGAGATPAGPPASAESAGSGVASPRDTTSENGSARPASPGTTPRTATPPGEVRSGGAGPAAMPPTRTSPEVLPAAEPPLGRPPRPGVPHTSRSTTGAPSESDSSAATSSPAAPSASAGASVNGDAAGTDGPASPRNGPAASL